MLPKTVAKSSVTVHCYQKQAKEGLTRTFQVEQIASLFIMGLKFFSSFKIYKKKKPDNCFKISL